MRAKQWFHIISQLKKARKEAGLTQCYLAEIAGVSQQCISRFEQGISTNAIIIMAYMRFVPKALEIVVEGAKGYDN